jgi:lysophospholipase L1-like esterase
MLPQSLSNEIATGYHNGFTGIYQYNPEMYMNIMKPNFEREMYFNGYHWLHKTDWKGFRNSINRYNADVVLLGDSMIYGHGVDETYTVRHQLEKFHGLSVNNLGMQGASAHQEYQIMKKFALDLKPKFVFLFFLTNDIKDLTVYLTDEQMHQFIEQQSDIKNIRYFKITHWPFWKRLINNFYNDLYVARASYALLKILTRNFVQSADASPNSPHSLPLFVEFPRLKVALDFHLDAVKKMHLIATENNIIFTNVFIYTGQKHYAKEESVYEKEIQYFCQTHNIPFLNLHEIFNKKMKEGEMLFLENDGHFSPQGAQLAAKVLASYIKKHEAE